MHSTIPESPPRVKSTEPPLARQLTPTLALLPPAWHTVIRDVHWLNAEQTPIRCLDRRVSSGHGVLGVTSAMDGCVRVYLRTCEPEVILHEAMHAIVFVTGFKVDQCQPLDEIFSLARRTHRTIDPAFANIAWSYSLTNRDEFLAQLAAMTLTEPDYDPAHPLLHPCAELLWPGSTEAIMAVETAINDACLQKEPSQ